MKTRLRIFVLSAAIVAVGVVTGVWAWSRSDPYRREMRPVYAVIEKGEQGWGGEAIAMLHRIMARSRDRHALADRLLSERDGSLVAEGMVLAVESDHPRARAIVEAHLADERWNWSLANNDQLAKQLRSYIDRRVAEPWVMHWIDQTASAR